MTSGFLSAKFVRVLFGFCSLRSYVDVQKWGVPVTFADRCTGMDPEESRHSSSGLLLFFGLVGDLDFHAVSSR